MLPEHLASPNTFDIFKLGIPIASGSLAYTVYLLMNYTNNITSQYVVKMSYSKDKVILLRYLGTCIY